MDLLPSYYFSSSITKRKSPIQGFGQFAISPIKVGEVVIEAGGELVSKEMLLAKKKNGISFLMVSESQALVVDCVETFNVSFLNHSCDPNLTFCFPVWKAKRDIFVGEEVTTDYSSLGFRPGQVLIKDLCNCASRFCRSRIIS